MRSDMRYVTPPEKLWKCRRDLVGVIPVSRKPFKTYAAPPGRARAEAGIGGGLTSLFTKLRLPNRKTRPPLRTVITLALRKSALDTNRCREGDAYLAQIRQSRCLCAGISFV